jgi:hypothetical protein
MMGALPSPLNGGALRLADLRHRIRGLRGDGLACLLHVSPLGFYEFGDLRRGL